MAESDRRRLGQKLREHREAAGLEQEDAAKILDRDRTVITRLEKGRRGVRQRELSALLDAYGVDDPAELGECRDLARRASERDPAVAAAASVSGSYASYVGLEAEAREIRAWEPMLVHGLLQTVDYARAAIRGTGRELSADEVERRVGVRMDRQARVARSQPRLWVVMDEASLRRPAGGREIQKAQLEHLMEVAADPRVTVQVVAVAAGMHPGVTGPVTVLRFEPPDDDVVYCESLAGDVYPAGSGARACLAAYDHIVACAMDARPTLEAIHAAIKEL